MADKTKIGGGGTMHRCPRCGHAVDTEIEAIGGTLVVIIPEGCTSRCENIRADGYAFYRSGGIERE
jgi:hypothetical protein